MTIGVAQAFDDTNYPNLNGQWDRFDPRGGFDQTKPAGKRATSAADA